MQNHSYFKGKIVPLKEIRISPYDLSLLRGYGIFDVMCTWNGKPFMLDDHWKRLQNSADELGLRVPLSKKEFEKVVAKLLKLNGFKKSIIRTVLTGGENPDAFSYQAGQENLFILIEKFQPLPDELYRRGARVITLDYGREFPWAKINNYAVAIKNQKMKEKGKALEIVYVKDGQALEASTSNFFIFQKNRLITTKDQILAGITRKVVIALAKKAGFSVEERKVDEKELYAAAEIFLTATNKDIVPVVRVNGQKIGNGTVGKNTRILMKAFQSLVKKY